MFSVLARAACFVLLGLAALLAVAAFTRRSREIPVTWVAAGTFPKHHVTVWLGQVDPAVFSPCELPDDLRVVAAAAPAPTVIDSPGSPSA